MKQNYSLQFIKMKTPQFKEASFLEEATTVEDSIVLNKHFKDIIFDEKIEGVSFEDCKFENCTFLKPLIKCIFFNTKFTKCEMSNIILNSANIHTCLFEHCHMVGINYILCSIQFTKIINSHMKLSSHHDTLLKKCKIEDSNLSSSIYQGVRFFENELEQLDLRDSEFIHTKLDGVDISNCNIEGMLIDPNDIRGMIATEVQAIELISLLGIKLI